MSIYLLVGLSAGLHKKWIQISWPTLVVLETPDVAGTTTEVIFRTLADVCLSVCVQIMSIYSITVLQNECSNFTFPAFGSWLVLILSPAWFELLKYHHLLLDDNFNSFLIR